VYGYFPARANGNDLVIYDPVAYTSGNEKEIECFTFPRQNGMDRLCLADYFLPVDQRKMDLVAFQVVSVGEEATSRFERQQNNADYSEGYYSHGLAVQTAEAAANYLHAFIRNELKMGAEQGKRYSWGYPAIPELSDHAKVFRLLPAESKLGMSLTTAYQLVPEQSTAAIIVHHPLARYFNTGESRVDQLTR
jgi:5-methyltetrahydrofolate--homocysteine methyltransferase